MIRKLATTAGVALALGSGVASYKSARNDARANRDYPPVGQFITINGTRVHYVVEGSGPALVLIHGAGGNLRDFTFSLSEKLAENHTVIAFDRPGHGFTEILHEKGESLAEQAALLKAATDALGYPRAIVGGYSFGGAVALRWALDYPSATQGLLLMNAVSNPWVLPPSKLYALAAGPVTGPLLGTTLSAFAPRALVEDTLTSIFAPKPAPKGYLEHIGASLTLRKITLRANGRQVNGLLPQIEEQSLRYPELHMPVEIIHGAEDVTVPPSVHADVLSKQLDNVTYTKVKGVGHSVHHYAQDEILAAAHRLSQ
ncbi:alpha/beta fold hydrolase [Neptunicoccus cionae]|uniref:alpha/beta fold hydrolase n=1 Tax=Neptunicoccus cionae TaxID=2035344 RepID=UPI000C770302|nr:alpha/beta hydrolase [Amylibacter cionae]PLS20935.1 alpha/beta hydrolase [Amylibacter cionae]